MTVATIEMSETEVEQLRADLASARAEVKRLRGERLAQHPDRAIDDKFERVVAERDDLAGVLAETERERDKAEAERDHLAEQNTALREVNVKLGRVDAENQRLQRTVSVLVGERDTARAELTDARNRIAGIRETNRRLSAKWQGYAEQARQREIKANNLQRHLDDANAALIAASEDRLMAQTLSRALDNAIAENRRLRATTEEKP